MRVLAFGTYEKNYPRNRIAIDGLRCAGIEVDLCHEPVWEIAVHKSGRALSVRGLLRWAWVYLRAALRLLRRARAKQFDCVLVGYPAHADMLLARLVAGKRPIIFNPLVSLYDTLVVDRQRFAAGGIAARAVRFLDRTAFGIADRIVIDTDTHARWLEQDLGIGKRKLSVVPVGAEEIFEPLADVVPPVDPFSVLFYGKLIPLHGIETVLDAAELIELNEQKGPSICIRVVGTGQLGSWLDAELERRRLSTVERVPWIEYESLPRALCTAHLALGIFGTSDKAQRVIPNKAYQALACGTPLITADTFAARELLSDGENALLVKAGDAEALASAVLRLWADEALRIGIGVAGRELFKRRCSVDQIGKELATVCELAKAESVG